MFLIKRTKKTVSFVSYKKDRKEYIRKFTILIIKHTVLEKNIVTQKKFITNSSNKN